MQKLLLFSIAVLCSIAAISQDFSNKGKDFWVGYGYHQQMTNGGGGGSQDMVLYFATDQVTNITIVAPGIPYTIQTITTAAGNNVLTSVTIPKTGPNDVSLRLEGLSNKGIHITSDKPMVAYAHVYNASVSGATILYPTNTLGKEYYSVNYKNWSNSANSNCWFYVVAADTGTTTVEITPTGNTLGGWVAGTTYTVNLTQGQIYNVMGALTSSPAACNPVCTGVDLTGSKIKSISTGNGCKKIAVFSGSGRISITCNTNSSSSDNYMVQALPKTAWGKKYLTVPANGNQAFNFYRVCVSNPATVVKINGVVTALPLQGNFYYEINQTNLPQLIEADSAILVAQYFTSQGACGNGTPGDPEVIYLSAVEQNINRVLWNATTNFNITIHDFNVVIPNTGTAVSSFTLDGVPTGGFVVHPQDANYVYLKKTVTPGFHIIQSDSGFNAIAYGFGNAESYGFNAGTNIKDLYQQIGVSSQYGIETSPSVCTNSPFKFKVSLPYIPDSMYWNFHNAAGMMPNNTNVMVYNVPVNSEDSFTVVNGRTIHWYSLPTLYNFTTVGVYPITITTYVPNSDCGSVQDIDFDLSVTSPPVADFSWGNSGCVAEPVKFTETTPQFPKATYHFWWDFGDPASGVNNTSALRNPTHAFSAPGTYTVRFSDITTPGCLSDTIVHSVIVNPLPTGTISGTTTVCINTAPPTITFTATDGTAPYTFTYNINGGAPININTVAGNTVSILAPTGVAGVFVYTLMSVKNTGSVLCTQNVVGQTATVTVLPDHSIVLTSPGATANQTVCINTPIIPIIYTLGGGATGATVTGLPSGVNYVVAGNILTISGAPTTAVGSPFNYSITTTGNSCITASAIGTITVNGNHSIALSSAAGTDNQTLCINTPITDITYTLGGGATGATVTGLPAGVTSSVAGNTLTITGTPTTSVGSPFNYSITTTGNSCIVATASGTITVKPDHTIVLTSPGATADQTVCINTPIIPIVYTLGGGATGATVTGLPTGVNFVVAGNTLTISGSPSTTVGSPFVYSITTTGNSCVTASAGGTITVNADHTIVLSSAAGTNVQSVCINTPITDITYTLGGGATGATVTGLPAGVTSSVAGNTLTITGTPTTTVGSPFNYSIATTGNGCIVATASGTITVKPDHTIVLTSPGATANQTVCINTPIVPIVYTLGGGASGATVTGLPTGVNFVVAGNTLTISGSPSTTVGSPFVYSITTTGNSCITASLGGTITVNPDHTIVLSSAAGTNIQTVCIFSPITNITYTLGGGATGITVTGLPAGINFAVAGSTVTISGIPTTTVGSPFNYTVTTTGNSCIVATRTGTITVNPLPTGNFNFNAPSCETRIITFTDASVANLGVLNGWSWDFGDPASGAANTSNLQNPVHTFATAGSYIVTLIVTSSTTCVSNSFQRTVVINARPQAGYIIPEVCLSDTYAQFTDTSSITAGSIVAWAWNFGDPPSGVNNTSILQNPQHSYSAVGNYNVQLIVTSNSGCKDTIVHVLTVNGSFPVAGFTVNNPATLCANDSVAIVNTSTVFPGTITKVEIWWDDVNAGPPAPPQLDDFPFPGKVYKHLYPNFQAPLTKVYRIRFRAYSGGVCLNDKLGNVTINAAPKVQFNAMPDTCFLASPFQITQASEVGGVPGSGIFSGPGITPTGIFSPAVAGIGIHTIRYTYTSTAAGCVDTMSRTIRVLDTATAIFTFGTPICDGVAASFTDQSTAPAGVVLGNTVWDFGDLSPLQNHAPGSTFTHLFPGPGTYIVKMYNVSVYGCNSTLYSQPVTVDPNHSIVLTSGAATANQTVCINTAITPITYTLGGGATGAVVTGLPAGVTFAVAGTTLTISGSPSTAVGTPFNYSVTTTGNTCTTASANGSIAVSSNHTITLTSAVPTTDQRMCLNTPITDITYSLGGGATGVVITGLPPSVTFTVVGNTLTITGSPSSTAGTPYNYSITTTGNNCVTASAAGVIKVSPYPRPDFLFDKPSYCIPNALVTFNNTSTIEDGTENAFTYLWTFDDIVSGNNSSVAKSPSHYYASTGPFNVKLRVTSGFGCQHDTTIKLNTIHPQLKADFNSSKPGICIRDMVTFNDQTIGNVQQWNWDFGDRQQGFTNPINHLYLDTATFNVRLFVTDNFGCSSDTMSKPFTVYPYPILNIGPDRFILEGGTIILQPAVYGNDLQYLWTPNLYLSSNSILQPTVFSPKDDITYKLTVTARGGCTLSKSVFVKLLRFPKIPNTFTPNNDGINDTWRIDYLNTYPNNWVQVFTRTGQLVFESHGYNQPWDGTFKGKPLPFDTYYYIIEPGNGRDPLTGYVTIVK